MPTSAKFQLYEAGILPYLTYCGTVWNFCKASDSRKLERVQERGVRAIYCDSDSSYQTLLGRAKLLTLQNTRLRASIAILMFKVKRHLCPDYIMRLFSYNKY